MFFKALNLFFWSIFLLCFSAFAQQETLTITTYYPAPLGVYGQLVTNTLGVGNTNGAGGITGADAPNPATNRGDVWITGNVGIGTNTTQNRLDVSGSAVIGATYSGNTAAPANSLLVEGDVGVGVPMANLPPNGDLEINGALRLLPATSAPVATSGQNQDLRGTLYYSNATGDIGPRYHDGTSWKKLGSITLGNQSAPVESQPILWQQSTFPVEISAACPAGSMVTGVRVWTAGGCPCSCGAYCDDPNGPWYWAGRVQHIGVVCKALQ